jgi:arylsulfatase
VGEGDSEPVAFWRAEFTAQTSRKSQNLQKVKEMKAAFIAEAKTYQVFSLDASVAARIVVPRPNITAGLNTFVYTHPMVGAPGRFARPAQQLLHR